MVTRSAFTCLTVKHRKVVATAVLGNGQEVHGSSPGNQAALGPLPVIYAGHAAVSDKDYAGEPLFLSLHRLLLVVHCQLMIMMR